MVTQTYGDGISTYHTDSSSDARASEGDYRSAGELIFLWLAWTLAFAFWAFTMSSFFGIFHELSASARGGMPGGAADAGGVSFLMMDVIGGVVVLGAALAWGIGRDKTRDRSLDPTTEASTAALYNDVERAGGDDMVSRSPDARGSLDRDSYRPA